MLKKRGLSLACCFMLILMGGMSTAHANLIEDAVGLLSKIERCIM